MWRRGVEEFKRGMLSHDKSPQKSDEGLFQKQPAVKGMGNAFPHPFDFQTSQFWVSLSRNPKGAQFMARMVLVKRRMRG